MLAPLAKGFESGAREGAMDPRGKFCVRVSEGKLSPVVLVHRIKRKICGKLMRLNAISATEMRTLEV